MTGEHGGQGPSGGGAPGGEPSEEELRAALEEQMRNIRVEEVLVQTVVTLVNLGARRLGLATAPGEDPAAERDLDQARTAIEAVRVLLPLCPAEPSEQIKPALAQLQMAYARDAQGGEVPEPAAPPEPSPGEGPPAAGGDPGEQDRAKARARIWTPPGS